MRDGVRIGQIGSAETGSSETIRGERTEAPAVLARASVCSGCRGVRAGAACGGYGMRSTWPTLIMSGFAMPLALAMTWNGTPKRSPIADSVSPGWTV